MSAQGNNKSKWGSFLSQAVAGVEARLDTILAEEEADKQPPKASPSPSPTPSQQSRPARSDSTRSRTNDRLQERLARAVAAKQAAQKSESSASKATPTASPRQSLDISTGAYTDSARPQLESASSPRASQDIPVRNSRELGSGRESLDEVGNNRESQSISLPPSSPWPQADSTPVIDLQDSRIKQLERSLDEIRQQHQEETHTYVEQIDALQSKLQYLARETTDAAKKVAQDAPPGSMEKKIAEKDQQIAGLMEEGKNLASTEQKLRTVIKNLRSKISEVEKELNNVKTSCGKTELEMETMRRQSKRADDLEKYQEELHKRIGQSQKDIDALRSESASKDRTISDLKAQLRKAGDQAEALMAKINDEALSKERARVRDLEEDIADLKVEKDLIVDRSKAQANELKEKAERAAERARVVEVELKSEMQIMESKLEAMRVRAEEVSSGAMGDSQAKLLRQVETLQTQYAIASENWQGIENTLLSRIGNLEKERDEAQHRESEMRKKAREAAARARRNEEELEETKTQLPTIQEDVKSYQSQLELIKKRAEEAEEALAEAKTELEKQKQSLKEEKASTRERQDRQGPWLEDLPGPSFRSGSRPQSPLLTAPTRSFSTELLGLGSLSSKFRKHSAPSSNGDPVERYVSRRPSVAPLSSRQSFVTGGSNPLPPILSPTVDVPPSPYLERSDTFDGAEISSSPKQIANDMVSVSTIGAGPSVQLVERMSAAIRRLETEKVAAKEELMRISSQRDEARTEMVTLMREVSSGKKAMEEVAKLQAEVAEVNQRYETTLEMLGEKSEMVEELKADVQDVKDMYRDLVERTIK